MSFADFLTQTRNGRFERISPLAFVDRLDVWVGRVHISDTSYWNILENGLTKKFTFEQWTSTPGNSQFAKGAIIKSDEFDEVWKWIKDQERK